MGRYRKKPIVISAERWLGGDYAWLDRFCGQNWGRADAKGYDQATDDEAVVVFNTEEQAWIHIPVGHWIIRGMNGELYPCSNEIFEKTYEPE